MKLDMGSWTEDELVHIMKSSLSRDDPGKRIAAISEYFLGTAYQESTLTGDVRSPEELVVNLSGVDCFTFLDYVEAMRVSGSFAGFLACLKRVRYRGGMVSFRTRNHFFTDWTVHNPSFVMDVTAEIGKQRVRNVHKMLNLKKDGSFLLEGIEPKSRTITYIPADSLDETMAARLSTGDYAGIYTEREGLDVSHVGIIIRKQGALFLRHASSVPDERAVIDQDLREYMKGRPGLIVLRSLDLPVKISDCS